MSRNLYDEHPFMADHGTFWRCEHGTTGFGSTYWNRTLTWVGCKRCALKNPIKALRHWWNNRE